MKRPYTWYIAAGIICALAFALDAITSRFAAAIGAH